MDVFLARATHAPAPPEMTPPPASLLDEVSVMLQFTNLERTNDTDAALYTTTAPPRTAMLEILAPLAVQFKKLQDEIRTAELCDPGNSTASAPPLLLEGTPLLPNATYTELPMKLQSIALKLDITMLLAYTAPPPPLDVPGRTDVEVVNALHSMKFEFEMMTVKLNPTKLVELGEDNRPFLNSDTCGECSIANAPP